MTFDSAAMNLIVLLSVGFGLLGVDLYLWIKKRQTFSETIWAVNARSLWVAFIIGVLAGHLVSVPR
jgi:hypothetical protein